MDRIEGSQGVGPDTVMVGNYISERSDDSWIKVVSANEFTSLSGGALWMMFHGPNGEHVAVPIADNQITVKTERVAADQIRKDDDVQHPESGDWVKLHNIAEGTLGTRTAAVHRKSQTLTFYYEEDSSGHPGEFDSYIEIPGEQPALGTPKNPFIWRRVRE